MLMKTLLVCCMHASYFLYSITLQVLWEAEREATGQTEKQSFVDLGCGNGLLVHLLTQEGVSLA